MGKHSKKENADDEYEPIELLMGKHSKKENKITEDFEDPPGASALIKHYKNFTAEDINHIKKYTKSSRKMNTALVKEKPLGSLEGHATGMDAVLKRHKTPKSMVVYSGVGKSHPMSKHINDTKSFKVIHKGFTSTSLSKDIAKDFAQGIFSKKWLQPSFIENSYSKRSSKCLCRSPF
jgi:hypothetical protein